MIVPALVVFMLLHTFASFSSHSSTVVANIVGPSTLAAASVNMHYSPTYVREDSLFVYLGNGFLEIQFDKIKGGILSITNKMTGQEYTSRGPFFYMHVTDSLDTWLDSEHSDSFEHSYSVSDKSSVLHFKSHFTETREGYDATVSVDIRVVANSSLSYWSFAFKDLGAGAADHVEFPVLSSIKPPVASSNDYAIVPDAQGTLLHDPFQTLGTVGLSADDYPSVRAPLQMMVLGNAAGGLYLATYDTTGGVKSFGLWKDRAGNVDAAVTHKLPESPGGDVIFPYETVVGVFDGAWT